MSSIVQKLVDEICEESPAKQSKQSVQGNLKKLHHASSSKYDGRSTRTITVEKERVINKVVPGSSPSKGRTVINKFKSKETLLKKKFIDTALNTIITGPLRCDHDCVTMVRKRDYKDRCKCSPKRPTCRMSVKEIQTLNTKKFAQMDKACTQCVEMVNCGTQFLDKLGGKRIVPSNIRSRAKLCIDVDTQSDESSLIEKEKSRNNLPTNKYKKNDDFMGARRWALSQYPARGPDF